MPTDTVPPQPTPSLAARPVLSGALSQLSVAELLQTAEIGRRSGLIRLRAEGRQGSIWLRAGRIVDAAVERGPVAAEAIYAMALWTDGDFEADFTAVDVTERINESTSGLLLEAMRRHDEAAREATPPNSAIVDPPPRPPRELLALHRGLTLLNIAISYALDHAEPRFIVRHLDASRAECSGHHPWLAQLRTTPEPAVVASPDALHAATAETVVGGIAAWLRSFFGRLDQALPGTFPLRRLRQFSEAIQDDLTDLGYYDGLGLLAANRPTGDA